MHGKIHKVNFGRVNDLVDGEVHVIHSKGCPVALNLQAVLLYLYIVVISETPKLFLNIIQCLVVANGIDLYIKGRRRESNVHHRFGACHDVINVDGILQGLL